MLDTNAICVFNTPELLSIICGYCGSSSLARLTQTSQYTFKVAAPWIWKNLKSVQPLMLLLRLTIVLKDDPVEHLDITLPAYSPEAFARFDLYGSLVQTLEMASEWKLDKRTSLGFSLSPWECLGNLKNLLPNLHRLTVFKGFSPDEEILLWLSIFVRPGLQSLNVCAVDGLSESSIIIALDLLQEKCPGLKQLWLASGISASPVPLGIAAQTAITQMVYSPMALRRLQGFRSLASLHIPSRLVNSESLTLIARLPKLDNLHIRNDLTRNDNLMEVLRSTPLFDNAFPAITRFHVTSSRLCAALTDFQIVSQMTRTTVVVLRYQSDEDDILPNQTAVLDNVAFITTPELRPRSWPMYLGEMPIDWEALPRITSRDPTWNYVRQLPLAQLGILNSGTNPPFMRKTFPTFPLLTCLELPDHLLTVGHLVHLGQLIPGLLCLRSNLVDILDEVPQIEYRSTALLQIFELVRPLERRLKVRFPDKFARFLSSIWPSIQAVTYEDQSRETQPGLELLNTHLRAAWKVAEIKENIGSVLSEYCHIAN
ncbi:hypothetical protein FRC12_008196 [Ceratobasidium sp. 428]|nr:hypothetical protein FRC12_008196 [Ceratobasidium sp. 428]